MTQTTTFSFFWKEDECIDCKSNFLYHRECGWNSESSFLLSSYIIYQNDVQRNSILHLTVIRLGMQTLYLDAIYCSLGYLCSILLFLMR